MITVDKLVKVSVSKVLAAKFVGPLNDTIAKYQINTNQRICHFLAQILHESGRLYYTKEIASGEAYDTGKKAIELGNTPEDDDDGRRYKGRGLIQITGRTNYMAVSKELGIDFIKNPELLELPQNAAMSAGFYWNKKGLNALADKDSLMIITKRINGGYNGLKDREELLLKCKKVFL